LNDAAYHGSVAQDPHVPQAARDGELMLEVPERLKAMTPALEKLFCDVVLRRILES
jgi:hypothetical protein